MTPTPPHASDDAGVERAALDPSPKCAVCGEKLFLSHGSGLFAHTPAISALGPPADPPQPADPLEGAVEVDWQRPLDEWETAFKDELFMWGPFFRGLGHGHAYLDANARYALARIAGILHRRAGPPADDALRDLDITIRQLQEAQEEADALREALVECRDALSLYGMACEGKDAAISAADAALAASESPHERSLRLGRVE